MRDGFDANASSVRRGAPVEIEATAKSHIPKRFGRQLDSPNGARAKVVGAEAVTLTPNVRNTNHLRSAVQEVVHGRSLRCPPRPIG